MEDSIWSTIIIVNLIYITGLIYINSPLALTRLTSLAGNSDMVVLRLSCWPGLEGNWNTSRLGSSCLSWQSWARTCSSVDCGLIRRTFFWPPGRLTVNLLVICKNRDINRNRVTHCKVKNTHWKGVPYCNIRNKHWKFLKDFTYSNEVQWRNYFRLHTEYTFKHPFTVSIKS